MLANIDLIKRSFEQVKDAVQASIRSERAREGIKLKSGYDDDHDVPMYGDVMKPQYAMPPHEVKKRRGVSRCSMARRGALLRVACSEPRHLDDAIAAIGSIPPSGDEAPTVPGRCATPAGFTTPSWRGNASWRHGRYGPSPRIGAEPGQGAYGATNHQMPSDGPTTPPCRALCCCYARHRRRALSAHMRPYPDTFYLYVWLDGHYRRYPPTGRRVGWPRRRPNLATAWGPARRGLLGASLDKDTAPPIVLAARRGHVDAGNLGTCFRECRPPLTVQVGAQRRAGEAASLIDYGTMDSNAVRQAR